MQSFTTYREAASKVALALNNKGDDDWKMITDDEKFDISDGYDLTRNDNIYSLYCKVRMLAGTDWKTNHPGVPLDRIQITRWHPDTCDCVHTFTWDRDTPEDDRPIHPHKGERHCEHHEHLKHDCHAHYWEVRGENNHKTHAILAVADTMVDQYVKENRPLLEHIRLNILAEHGNPLTVEQIALFRLRHELHANSTHKKGRDGKRKLHVDHPYFTDMKVVQTAMEAVEACPNTASFKRECDITVRVK